MSGPPKRRSTIIIVALMLIGIPLTMFIVSNLSKNHYGSVRYYGNKIANGPKDTTYYKVPALALRNENGQPFTTDSLKGKIYLVNFIFTRCPGICKQLTATFSNLQVFVKDKPEVNLVSITVDPRYDTSTVIKAYADKHKFIPGKWHFLYTDTAALTPTLNAYLNPKTEPNIDPLQLGHSGLITLVDKEGHIRGVYDGTDRKEIARIKDDIDMLKYEYANRK